MSYVAKLPSGKTNGITYIPQDIKLELDPINVTRVGKPVITHGIANSFTSANYLTIPSFSIANGEAWEISFKININSIGSQQTIFGSPGSRGYNPNFIVNANGILGLHLSNSTSSWNVVNMSGSTVLSINTDYWVKAEFTGSAYNLYLSNNGVDFTLEATTATTAIFTASYQLSQIGYSYDSGSKLGKPFSGSIDLSQSYIKINNEYWWKGGTGDITLKAGSKVYIPNGDTFDTVNIEEDVVNDTIWGTTEEGFICWDNHSKRLQIGGSARLSSGPNAPTATNFQCWLDTTEKKVKIYRNAIYEHDNISLPLAIVDLPGDNGPSINLIKQIFNGFGYIGSTVYGLPGVKGICTNGIDGTGRYKNQEFEFTNIMYSNVVTGSSNQKIFYKAENVSLLEHTASYKGIIDNRYTSALPSNGWYFIEDEGYMSQYNNGWIYTRPYCICGDFSVVDGIITSISTNTNLYERNINYLAKLPDTQTNGITYIPQDINMSIDPLNVTVIGTPTVNRGIISNFSTANYLTLPKIFQPSTGQSWEVIVKFNVTAWGSTWTNLFGQSTSTDRTAGFHLMIDSNRKLKFECTSDGSAWQVNPSGVTTIELNKTYWSKWEFTGTHYNCYLSTDGENYNLEASVANTMTTKGTAVIAIGPSISTANSCINGTIYLNECYIKINNEYWWKGGTGDLVLKEGSKIFIPFGLSSDNWYTYSIGDIFMRDAFKIVNKYNFNGKMFIQAEITKDLFGWRSTESNNYDRFLNVLIQQPNSSSGDIAAGIINNASSGSSKTSEGEGIFYDLDKNIITYYNKNNISGNILYSLPIGVSTTSNNMIIGRIKSVFNGSGYIGSTYYVLPGVKCSAANGKDGMDKFKNIDFETTNIYMVTFNWNPGANDLFIKSDGSLTDRYYVKQNTKPSQTHAMWYNPDDNIMMESVEDASTFNNVHAVRFAQFTDDNNVPAKILTFDNTINDLRTQKNLFRVKRGGRKS